MEEQEVGLAIKQFARISKGLFRFQLKNESNSRIATKAAMLDVKNKQFIVKDGLGAELKFEVEEIQKIWFVK